MIETNYSCHFVSQFLSSCILSSITNLKRRLKWQRRLDKFFLSRQSKTFDATLRLDLFVFSLCARHIACYKSVIDKDNTEFSQSLSCVSAAFYKCPQSYFLKQKMQRHNDSHCVSYRPEPRCKSWPSLPNSPTTGSEYLATSIPMLMV